MKKKTAIVLGGGFTGCSIAYLLSQKGWKVIIVEKEGYVGGGARTFWYGGHPYTEGARIFHCPKSREDIYNFMNNILPMVNLEHYLSTYVEQDKRFYSYPIHVDDINTMPDKESILKELNDRDLAATPNNFEEFWTLSVGQALYEKYVKEYSKKMWDIDDNKNISDFSKTLKGDAINEGTREVHIGDWLNAYPKASDGYNSYFEKCIMDVDLFLGCEATEFDLQKKRVKIGDDWKSADIIISTISPDELMRKAYGELPYMGRDYMKVILPIEHALPPKTQFLYNPNKGGYLRIVEYKHLTRHKADDTLLLFETPSKKNKLYPYPMREAQEQADKYLSNLPSAVYSIGRLGRYKYTNIWEILSDAFELMKELGD